MSISPDAGQLPYAFRLGSNQMAGHSQSPAGSFALIWTRPYLKLNDSIVRTRAVRTGFMMFVGLPDRSQPQDDGFVHLRENGGKCKFHFIYAQYENMLTDRLALRRADLPLPTSESFRQTRQRSASVLCANGRFEQTNSNDCWCTTGIPNSVIEYKSFHILLGVIFRHFFYPTACQRILMLPLLKIERIKVILKNQLTRTEFVCGETRIFLMNITTFRPLWI